MTKGKAAFLFGATMLALTGALVAYAGATATCFCKISFSNLEGQTHAINVCQDLTGPGPGKVDRTYSGPFQQSEANQVDCQTLCRTAAATLLGPPPNVNGASFQPPLNDQGVANACCAIGAPNNSGVYAFSSVGNKVYRVAQPVGGGADGNGLLLNQPAVTQNRCPTGWLANPSNVDGGVTTDGRCKKFAGTLSIVPLPATGTLLGTYGFVWGNAVWAWGTTANGGAAVQTIVTAAACHF